MRETERDEGDQREGEREGWWSYVLVGVLGKGKKGRDERELRSTGRRKERRRGSGLEDQKVMVGPTGTPNKSKNQT